jgi:ABC-2 type transport system permease protein
VKSKVAVVARREFLTTVKRPSYLIATFGMPVFVLLIVVIAAIPAILIMKKESRAKTVGVVDDSGALGLTGPVSFTPPPSDEIERVAKVVGHQQMDQYASTISSASTLNIRPFPTLEAGQEAMRQGAIDGLFEFSADYLRSGRVLSYQKEGLIGPGKTTGAGILGSFAQERLLAGHLDNDLMDRVRRPVRVEVLTLRKDGTFAPVDELRELVGFFVPLLFCVLFFVSIMISSGFLLQGVSEEKENRVIEVILSSVTSDGLLAGKLLGLGAAGLLQIAIWMTLSLAVASKTLSMLPFHVESTLWSLVFYVLGFLLFGVLMMGTGSLGQNLKEVQQYGMMWSLASVVPMMFLSILVPEPNGLFARVLSFIPLTAPATMFMRLHSVDPPPWWETTLSAALLAVSAWFALKVMARLFRVGLLLYGKRPTIPAILKMLRRPA